MLRQQNDINLKVEDGDNFMSDYTTYTNYAKKAIDELQQLANFKKSLKGKKLADKIREAGLKLITKSGVDSILHGLGESNGFQNLTPAQKQIAEKLVSLKDTALTHKSSSIQGVTEGKLVESAVFLNPTTVVVGQTHGQPLELSPNTLKQIQAIAAKHGAWYEGNGTDRGYTKGQIDRYVGSWDDEVAKTVSSNDPKWLYVLFANVDENNRVQRVGIDPNDTIFNRLLDTAKDNSFQGIGYTSQTLKKFLQMASEGKYDFLKMSQQPATQENLTRFLKAGEALMWPSNWEQYPNKAGKIAKAATVDVRDQYLATRKAGVYVTGIGHLKAVQNITGKQGVAEGKITLSTDPDWYGATVGDYQTTGPVVNISASELVGFEPDDKMNQPKSKANVEKMLAGLKRGDKLPPLLVRKYKNGYQVLDGHHRFWAYKLSGVKNIPSQIVPDSDIEEISNQGVLDENAEMAQSDITKIIDYSEKLQSMFDVNDNLEDWVKAKLNHACDYVATVRDYLKFYNEEKQKGTQNIEEKWTNTYKKSIDCSNAKGFSQKAHCAARRKRQAGGKTQSKSVKECYKEAVQELLKEQNSSMAMGALKQLNSDAKELQTMLQPTTQLEDWVKSKLNLAGEYLDDVYHHLDHFGSKGRQFDENYYTDKDTERQKRMLRFSSTTPPEKKYWFTPSGTVAEAGLSHEGWIKNNDPSLVGATLVDTYDNAIRKGYIRAVVMYDVLFLSNMLNHDFSMNGNSNDNIPVVKSIVLDAIKNFVKEKNIKSVATGKGKPIKDLSPDEEDQITEDWKKKLATAALAASTMFGTPDVQSAPALTRPETTAVSQVKQLYTVEDVIAATIVDEAGGEKNAYEGMQAVLNVIMNRVNGDVRKAAMQCLKPYQFSGWNKVNKKDSDSIKKYIDSKKSHARFKIALDLVNQAKSGSLKDITSGANHFLNVQLTKQQRSSGKLPSWYNKDKVVADIGRHQFLKLQEMHELS